MICRLGAVAVCLLVLSACGSPTLPPGGSAGSTPDPDTPVSSTAHHDDGPKGSGAQLVEPRDGLVDVRPHPWEKTKGKGRELTVFFWSGVEECYGLDRVDVKETERRVVVTLFEGRNPEADMCIEIAAYKRTIVRLQDTVGDRRVIDGAK